MHACCNQYAATMQPSARAKESKKARGRTRVANKKVKARIAAKEAKDGSSWGRDKREQERQKEREQAKAKKAKAILSLDMQRIGTGGVPIVKADGRARA